jgi:phosphate starvation-inducible PhoH-like protein
MAKRNNSIDPSEILDGLKIIVSAKTDEQKVLLRTINKNIITFVTGPAGTGKTFLAVAYGLQQLFKDKFEKLVLTRPVIEAAGEKLGFLPGDMLDKINPYLMPIYDAMSQVVPVETMNKLMRNNSGNGNGKDSAIRIIPLAYMRGVTFRSSFIICDEMQNSTPDQVRMLLTRLGESSKMIICGDIRQTDIQGRNGLSDAMELLNGMDDIGVVQLTEASIVRHELVQRIEAKYEARQRLALQGDNYGSQDNSHSHQEASEGHDQKGQC